MNIITINSIPRDWELIGGGSEADIYDVGDGRVAKIYKDWDSPGYAGGFSPDTMKDKFWEIQFKLLDMPDLPSEVIVPESLIAAPRGSVLGYFMPKIDDAVPLDKVYNDENCDATEKNLIVKALYRLLTAVHDCGAVIGDFVARDLAWNISTKSLVMYDGDSISFGEWKSGAFSLGSVDPNFLQFRTNNNGKEEAILDRPLTKESDWFAFLTICCRVYIGIDPYEVAHPKYDKTLCVKHGVSIFTKGVTFPDSMPDFKSVIPLALLREMFLAIVNGERKTPLPESVLNPGIYKKEEK